MPLAMRPLRDQMAHCRRTLHLPSALTRSPRRSRGGYTACERLVSGSTSNEITSCQATSRSEFSLFRLRKRPVVFVHALSCCLLIRPKQERIGTKGDGAERGTRLRRGLGAQMLRRERFRSRLNISAPSPLFRSLLHKSYFIILLCTDKTAFWRQITSRSLFASASRCRSV